MRVLIFITTFVLNILHYKKISAGHYHKCSGPGSSVGIATDYGLDGPGIESRWGEIFSLSRPTLGPTQPPVQWVPGLSRGLSTAGACC